MKDEMHSKDRAGDYLADDFHIESFDQMITDRGNEILRRSKPYLFNAETGQRLSEDETLVAQHALEVSIRETRMRVEQEARERELRTALAEVAAERSLQDRREVIHQLGRNMVNWAIKNDIPNDYFGLVRHGWIIESGLETVNYKGGYSVSHQGVQMSDPGRPINKATYLLLDRNNHFYRMRDRATKYALTRLIPVPYDSYEHINVNTLVDRIAQLSAQNDVPWK